MHFPNFGREFSKMQSNKTAKTWNGAYFFVLDYWAVNPN